MAPRFCRERTGKYNDRQQGGQLLFQSSGPLRQAGIAIAATLITFGTIVACFC